jgi:hypothetical protein
MFLDEPHNVTSFFGTIVKKLNEEKAQIFTNDHAYSPYYTSAFAYYKLESFFKKGSIDSSYKKVRFHILMLFRILTCEFPMPPLNSIKKMDKYCADLLAILNDEEKALKVFEKCVEIIDNSGFNNRTSRTSNLFPKLNCLLIIVKKCLPFNIKRLEKLHFSDKGFIIFFPLRVGGLSILLLIFIIG